MDVRWCDADRHRHYARDGIGNLGVSFDGRMRRLFVFVGQASARELFGHEPDLKLVPAQDVADQQIIGPIIAVRRCGMGRPAALIDDEFVSLQQAEQLNGGVLAPAGRASYARCLGNVVRHGDSDSAKGLNAFG
jgi:hypothetical protein